jgi:ribonuclease Z
VSPLFQARLVNGTSGDPALYIDFEFRRRALMFDLGDITTLAPRHVLRVTDIFVSHAHMDHFIGFDRILRLMLGRTRRLRLYGPTWVPGSCDPPGTRLYLESGGELPGRAGHRGCRAGSRWHGAQGSIPLTEPLRAHGARSYGGSRGRIAGRGGFPCACRALDHSIPCLGFALDEKARLSVWKNRLDELGLPTGPWLTELKRLARRDAPDDTPLTIA